MCLEESFIKMEELLNKNIVEITLADEQVIEQAKSSIRTIASAYEKSKAYYNVLAAGSVIEYLRSQGLMDKDVVNMHSSIKMLVDFEIADIQLPNMHIDVRAVFDENEIFIPKKHFETKIIPDVYLIVKLDEDLQNASILGFVEPNSINKQNQNAEYYFVNKGFLKPISDLRKMLLSKPNKSQYLISDDAESSIEKLIMLYMDNDIEPLKLEKLVDYLKNSVVAREKLIEFEIFERLSYMVLQEFQNLDLQNNGFTKYIKSLVSIDEFEQFEANDE